QIDRGLDLRLDLRAAAGTVLRRRRVELHQIDDRALRRDGARFLDIAPTSDSVCSGRMVTQGGRVCGVSTTAPFSMSCAAPPRSYTTPLTAPRRRVVVEM